MPVMKRSSIAVFDVDFNHDNVLLMSSAQQLSRKMIKDKTQSQRVGLILLCLVKVEHTKSLK